MDVLLRSTAFIILLAVLGAILVLFYFVPIGLWVSAITAGVKVRISELIGMRLRRVDPNPIVHALIVSTKAGVAVSVPQLEAHHLAGGSVKRLVESLIVAKLSGIDLSFEQAAAFDLANLLDPTEAEKLCSWLQEADSAPPHPADPEG